MVDLPEKFKNAAKEFRRLSGEKPKNLLAKINHTDEVIERVSAEHGLGRGDYERLFVEVGRQMRNEFERECWREEAMLIDRKVGELILNVRTKMLVRKGIRLDTTRLSDDD